MSSKKKLAIIASRFPYPLNKGDKLRLFHQIKYLSQFFDIYLYALNEEKIEREEQQEVRKLCKQLEVFELNILQKAIGVLRSFIKKEPLQVGFFFSKEIRNHIKTSLVAQNTDIVYCQLSRTAEYGLTFNGPTLLDYQDCFSTNYERAYDNSKGLKKWFYKREATRMKEYEQFIHQNFTATCIISENDKKNLPIKNNRASVIPNGVDTNYYLKQENEKSFDILFSGNLNYQPNIDAALFILEQIRPLLIKEMPAIRIGLAGQTNHKKLLKAADNNITLLGHVADLRTAYASTILYIAPMFTGAGLQNKLLEAMSMGIPCIASPLTNNSLQATPDKEILLAQNAQEFTDFILKLLKNENQRNELSVKGQAFIHANYNWDTQNESLKKLINSLL